MMNLFYSHYNIENYTFKISIIINHTCPRSLYYILLPYALQTKKAKYQLLMAGILWVNKTCCKCECCGPMENSIEGVCCLEFTEICKPRFLSTSCLNVCRLDPDFMISELH